MFTSRELLPLGGVVVLLGRDKQTHSTRVLFGCFFDFIRNNRSSNGVSRFGGIVVGVVVEVVAVVVVEVLGVVVAVVELVVVVVVVMVVEVWWEQ